MPRGMFVLLLVSALIGIIVWSYKSKPLNSLSTPQKTNPTGFKEVDPLAVEAMRKRSYPGSDIKIEQTLSDGSNYHQYIATYQSDGLKIHALLTVPIGNKPKNGWPIIVFNHGYIPPLEYSPTQRYTAYVDAFARNGYIVFKPNFRGNGQSEGKPEGTYYSPAYTTDDLNAIASIKKYPGADGDKLGVWGHSMGGNITLRDLVVRPHDVKAAVIWGGVVGSYTELFNWHDPKYRPTVYEMNLRNRHRQELVDKYGTPDKNPTFWATMDPNTYLNDVQAPVQLHHGDDDEEVPITMSQHLYDRLKSLGKTVELYTYPGDDHNISHGFNLAMDRSVKFFDTYLK